MRQRSSGTSLRRSAMAVAAGLAAAATMVAAPTSVSATPPPHAATSGGPVVLDGMDPVCHSYSQNTEGYIAAVLASLHSGASRTNDGSIAVLGSEANTMSCGGTLGSAMSQFVAGITPTPTVNYYPTDTDVTTLFTDIAGGTAQPAVLWIPDTSYMVVDTSLTAGATDIADFVNSGGGLFSNVNDYNWLSALLPSAAFNMGGCNGGPEVTTAGQAAFPSLTNSLVAACWHGYFTGNTGGLVPLVDYPYPTPSSPRVAVAIGGASVSLPSAVTVAASPNPAEVGQSVTVTATFMNGGNPASGVTVTFTVSGGPNAGASSQATTDSNGVATTTLTASATGTDVITASGVVNSVTKTASTSLVWNPASVTVPGAPGISVNRTLTTLAVTASPTTTGGSPITGYQITVGGVTKTLGGSGGTVTFTGLAPNTPYAVSIVATNVAGTSLPASATVSTLPVPTTPIPIPTLDGEAMYPGMAAVLFGDGLFAANSSRLTAAGRQQILTLAPKLRGAGEIRCEGHTEVSRSQRASKRLSAKRAAVVCALLRRNGVRAKQKSVGYGFSRPVVRGGTTAQRALNRRTVVSFVR